MERLREIRRAEAESHTEAYTNHELFADGSWLAKPVKTVLDLLPLLETHTQMRMLDLGCGVGRNSIPIAQRFREIPCRVECVDILEIAIEKLQENARQYGVEDAIVGIVSSIDGYEIEPGSYDLILAVSALEHTDSEGAFLRKLEQIREGTRVGGMVCLIINSGVQERDKFSGAERTPQFEVNFRTEELEHILKDCFSGWEVCKHTVVHQKYDIPRRNGTAALETDVVTYVVRRK